jgi:hypothetical protein
MFESLASSLHYIIYMIYDYKAISQLSSRPRDQLDNY